MMGSRGLWRGWRSRPPPWAVSRVPKETWPPALKEVPWLATPHVTSHVHQDGLVTGLSWTCPTHGLSCGRCYSVLSL